jgi:hypothetical protein
MPSPRHHAYWISSANIPTGPTITPIRYTSEFIVATYYFSDGRDLDTRTKLVDPDVGDYLGWARASNAGSGLIQWGGDNTGTGLESVAINVNLFKASYPAVNSITVDFRCFWFGSVGYNPVRLNVVLYKGGALRKVGYGWDNPSAAQSKDISTASKNITSLSNLSGYNGQGLARLRYNVYSGTGWFDTNLY